MTKRLHNYGNSEDIKTTYDEVIRKFKERIPDAFDVNSDMYPVADLNRSGDLDADDRRRKIPLLDFEETK